MVGQTWMGGVWKGESGLLGRSAGDMKGTWLEPWAELESRLPKVWCQ